MKNNRKTLIKATILVCTLLCIAVLYRNRGQFIGKSNASENIAAVPLSNKISENYMAADSSAQKEKEKQVVSTKPIHEKTRTGIPVLHKSASDVTTKVDTTRNNMDIMVLNRFEVKTQTGISLADIVVYFPLDKSIIYDDFMGNKAALEKIDSLLLNSSENLTIDSIYITGSASPDGNSTHNIQLAQKRADALTAYLLDKYTHLEKDKIREVNLGEDWNKLRELVVMDMNVPERMTVLKVLNQDIKAGTKKWRLQRIDKGKAWEYLLEHQFPELRKSSFMLFGQYLEKEAQQTPEQPKDTFYEETPTQDTSATTETERKFCRIALHSNLLYWVGLLPNIGFEWFIGDKWSLGAEGGYTWLETKKAETRYKGWYLEPELKYYFNSNRINSGHYVSLKGNVCNFNIMWKKNGHQGWFYGGSFGYAYMKRLNNHFNLDFGGSLGVLYMDVDKYKNWPNENKKKDDEFRKNTKSVYFGITGLRIGLTYRFN